MRGVPSTPAVSGTLFRAKRRTANREKDLGTRCKNRVLECTARIGPHRGRGGDSRSHDLAAALLVASVADDLAGVAREAAEVVRGGRRSSRIRQRRDGLSVGVELRLLGLAGAALSPLPLQVRKRLDEDNRDVDVDLAVGLLGWVDLTLTGLLLLRLLQTCVCVPSRDTNKRRRSA